MRRLLLAGLKLLKHHLPSECHITSWSLHDGLDDNHHHINDMFFHVTTKHFSLASAVAKMGKRQPTIWPVAILPLLAGVSVTCPVKKKKAKHASTNMPSSSPVATTSVPHLPFVPKSDCIEPSVVKQEEQQPESQKNEEELEALFDKISNYTAFDFLPFASFGRQGCVGITDRK